MPTEKTKRIPAPLYAAAGAGDLAYRKLRTLPAKMAQLRGKVAELRPVATVTEHDMRADLDRLRGTARRNAAAVVSGAHAAQERATVVYHGLVARGEQVVRTMRSDAAEVGVPAEIEAAPAGAASPGEPAGTAEAPTKPATKRTRPAAK